MGQIIDTYFTKLSEPVDTLGLCRKSRNCLRRAGVSSIAEILLAGRQKLASARGMGSGMLDHIWQAVAGYLDIAEHLLADVASRQEKGGGYASDASIMVLRLPTRTLQSMGTTGVYRIDELIHARTRGYIKLMGMEPGEIAAIDQALRFYMTRFALIRLFPWVESALHLVPYTLPPPPEKGPDLRLQLSKIDERAWDILELGAVQRLSMQAIGAQTGGISRERIRQIIRDTQEKLQRSLSSPNKFLDHFEEQSGILLKNLENNLLGLETLVQYLLADPVKPDLIIEEREVRQLIILIRSLVRYNTPWFWEQVESRWRTFVLLSCLAAPALREHERIRQIFVMPERAKSKITCKDLAYSVLKKAGQPMHWSVILEQARHLDGGDHLSAKNVGASLCLYKERFVRVGRGTYALAEWGSQTQAFYADIITTILMEAGRPISPEQVFTAVSRFRPALWSTILSILGTYYRFYKSTENTYGLRAWLSAAERQSDPMPDCLIEDRKSLQRVERSRAKGRDVDKAILEDALNPAP